MNNSICSRGLTVSKAVGWCLSKPRTGSGCGCRLMKDWITTLLLHATVILALLSVFAVARAEAETYTYDTVGRLTHVAYLDGTSLDYTYDANGNRLALVASAPTGGGGTGGGGTATPSGGGGGGCFISTIAGRATTENTISILSMFP